MRYIGTFAIIFVPNKHVPASFYEFSHQKPRYLSPPLRLDLHRLLTVKTFLGTAAISICAVSACDNTFNYVWITLDHSGNQRPFVREDDIEDVVNYTGSDESVKPIDGEEVGQLFGDMNTVWSDFVCQCWKHGNDDQDHDDKGSPIL